MSISLDVTVHNCDGLPAGDVKKKLHVELEFNGETLKTESRKGAVALAFESTHTFTLKEGITATTPPLVVKVFHASGLMGKFSTMIGRTDVAVGFLQGIRQDKRYHKLKGKDANCGRVNLSLKYTDPNPPTSSGGEAGVAATNLGGGQMSADQEELSDAQRGERIAAQNEGASLVKRDIVYSTKKQDFQIRIKVFGARSLQADGSIDPICKLTVNGERKQTRKKKSTLEPMFDELFQFSFHESPAKLLEEFADFEVYNAKSIRKDALIGSFRLDLGLVHQQPLGTIQRKWLMLSDPKEPAAGVKGYLKMTISVLGPGDVVPPDNEGGNEDEDVEGNLLRPVGVEVEPVDLVIKVFKGADMPQSDPSFKTGVKIIDKLTRQHDKEECDPYMVLQFGGQKVSTTVKDNTYSPEWMEELHLPAMLPSMCDNLTFRLMDSDLGFILNSDDILATHKLGLGHVSYSTTDGPGFLPCYGPTFINFYGSTREFDMFVGDDAEALNAGKGEGCAYRGRVLVELDSQAGGEKLDKAARRVELPESELARIAPFLGRKQYKIRIELIGLNMLSEKICDGPIEVELSMGNVGNIHETEVAAGTSRTMKERSVSDGSYYRFMPWSHQKPYLELTADWEDIEFRITSLNLLRRNANEFRNTVSALKAWVNKGRPATHEKGKLWHRIRIALEKYIARCTMALPELPQTLFTKLDYSLRELRELRKLEAADAARYALSHAPTVATDAGPLPLDQQGGLLERGYKALDDDKLLADLEALLRRLKIVEIDLELP